MIIIKLAGGLGNQMFQYAFGKSVSISQKKDLYLDTFELNTEKDSHRKDELTLFNTEYKTLDKNYINFGYSPLQFIIFYIKKTLKIFPFTIIQERKMKDIFYDKIDKYSGWFNYHSEIGKKIKKSKKDCYCIGFWQSYKYFEKERELLLKEFSPKQPPNEKNKQLLKIIKDKNSISIHIRRGDYTNKYHGILSEKYYKDAINYFNKRYKNTTFIIFSNEIQRCRKNLSIHNGIYVDRNTTHESYRDIILMSKCKHNIIANSSFSWRGAWLNTNPEKIIIAPQEWFQVPIDTEDLLPKERIKI
ncbi:MAG: alpha-1,2-fucosyltransferase [Candidatus Absconditabacteria bacterium]|nr:alpha-1,2-fucosyltransferase [Candidatus Absconditabacteria bacterium]MDD4714377.1 alpha-1,2-fucosyltransferase [Candidatus Absconditabacteria bacterium]